jgi:hypothetical protein
MFNKLAILALPRTGSSNLYYYFCDMFPSYRRAFEPLNTHLTSYMPPVEEIISGDKVIIKHLIPQELNSSKDKVNVSTRANLLKPTFSLDIFAKFKKENVILLTRKNKTKMVESLNIAKKTNKWFQKYDGSTAREGIEDLNKLGLLGLLEADKYLSLFSIEYNIPLFYYEDVFSTIEGFQQALDYIKLPYNEELYMKYIHPKNKYRQDDTI